MTIIFPVGAGLTRAGLPGLCADLAARLRGRPGDVVICDVTGADRADVVTAEALCRLRLTARRHGWRMVVTGADPALVALVRLLGLADALAADSPQDAASPRDAASPQGCGGAQAGGQAEQREEPPGVEEVVDPGDPPR